jgi:hypothetical protein
MAIKHRAFAYLRVSGRDQPCGPMLFPAWLTHPRQGASFNGREKPVGLTTFAEPLSRTLAGSSYAQFEHPTRTWQRRRTRGRSVESRGPRVVCVTSSCRAEAGADPRSEKDPHIVNHCAGERSQPMIPIDWRNRPYPPEPSKPPIDVSAAACRVPAERQDPHWRIAGWVLIPVACIGAMWLYPGLDLSRLESIDLIGVYLGVRIMYPSNAASVAAAVCAGHLRDADSLPGHAHAANRSAPTEAAQSPRRLRVHRLS